MKSVTEIEIILNVNDQVKNVNSSRALLKKKHNEFDNVLKFGAKLISSITNRNWQYPPIEIEVFSDAHDRFLIIDGRELYHIGASLKDLGKKWFAFSRMDIEVGRMLQILNN